jgi:hypothetical protein
MKARRLLEEQAGVYAPDQLKTIYAAFDAAWAEIQGHFDSDGTQAEEYRLRLASIILEEAAKNPAAATALKRAALQRLALDYNK